MRNPRITREVTMLDGTPTTLRVGCCRASTETSVGWPDYVSCDELDRLGISPEHIVAMIDGDEEQHRIGWGLLMGDVLSVVKYTEYRKGESK